MEKEIINRVAKSTLITFDLGEIRPKEERLLLDVSQWLEEGFLLREKDFREALNNYDWSAYANTFVALYCKTDAMLPAWTYLLVRAHLKEAKIVVQGSESDLEIAIFRRVLDNHNWESYQKGKVIIKGCSEHKIPEAVYVDLAGRLLPVVSSLMFGEACSTVPLYKAKS